MEVHKLPTLTFRGGFIRYFDCRLQEGGPFTRLHLTSDLSEPIREAMGWPAIPAEIESCKLSGSLAGDNMVVTPADKALKQYEFQLGIGEVGDFEIARIQDGEAKRTELRFKVRTASASAAAQLFDYLASVGQAPAAMRIKYAEQQSLTEEEAAAASAEPAKQEVTDEEQPPLDNSLNAMGSGRTKQKQRRGAPMAPAVVSIEPSEREQVEQLIDKSLQ